MLFACSIIRPIALNNTTCLVTFKFQCIFQRCRKIFYHVGGHHNTIHNIIQREREKITKKCYLVFQNSLVYVRWLTDTNSLAIDLRSMCFPSMDDIIKQHVAKYYSNKCTQCASIRML